MEKERKVAIVTGGSSGIGRSIATELRRYTCKVYEFSRTDNYSRGVTHVSCDITDEEQVKKAVDFVMEQEGRIDILVNNAGFGISGAAELTPSEMAHEQLELNLFGLDKVTKAVLPVMREQRKGRIVSMSSVAGTIPIPFQLWYSVSKAGIIAYMLALANEIRPYGITCCTMLPGDISSGFTSNRNKIDDSDGIYEGRVEKSVETMEHDEQTGMTTEYVGKKVAYYAMRRNSRPLVTVGTKYKFFNILAKLAPRRFTNWLVSMIYAK